MTVTETLGGLGSWSLTLSDQTPREILDALGFFGHVAIVRGRIDVDQVTGTGLLQAARYVGVLREKPTNARSLEGSGMAFWLGDEDNKGAVLETAVVLTAKTLPQCITAILPSSVHAGVVNNPGGTYTGTHQWETPRQALNTICAAFNVEYRVNGDGTLDVGTQAQLYSAAPDSIVSARGAGNDFDVQSIGGAFASDVSAVDYSSRVVLLGQTTDQQQIVTAATSAPTVPYKDLFGNTVAMTRMVADSGQTSGSVAASAALQLNRFNRLATALKVTAEEYETAGNFVVGDNSWVFDPDNGIFDASKQLDFRGELIFPAVVRITGITWPITDGHTVAFRTQDGAWLDLTRWVVWETGTDEITVGDLPKTLTSGGNPAQQYAQTAADASIPGPVTGLTLSSTAVQSSKGDATATLSVSWTAPAQNTDGSVITDLDHYLVQYRWHLRAPLWTTVIAPTTSLDIPGLSVGLPYDVQVAAVDRAGNQSTWNASGITTAVDQTAPNPPSDPTVTSYLGQLRIAWDGKDNTGAAMPTDFAIVEVHVSATSGFTPVGGVASPTLVAQLSAPGAAYATAPYGVARYVKLVSVDNSGNRSSPSGQATGTTAQVADGDVAALSVGKLTAGTMSADVTVSGRFATALTGARVEMNALGFQKFASDGVTKLVSITGTEALLTGTYKTAATGNRVEIGSAGTTGSINFYTPGGTLAQIVAGVDPSDGSSQTFTSGVPISGAVAYWNQLAFAQGSGVPNGHALLRSGQIDVAIGGTSNGMTVSYFADITAAGIGSAYSYTPLSIFRDRATLASGPLSGVAIRENIDVSLSHGLVAATFSRDGSFLLNMQSNGYVQIARQAGYGASNSSPSLLLQQQSGYGHLLTSVVLTGGTNRRLEIRDAGNSVWETVWAGAFTVQSSQATKTDVSPYSGGALAKVRGAGIKTYRRRGPGDTWEKRTEIGLLAEEAPPEITANDGTMVDLYQMGSLLWAAMHEVADRLAALEKGNK